MELKVKDIKPKLKLIKREKLSTNVARQLLELIGNGVLKLGDKLPSEKQLIEEMGVSRTSVREGMQRLEMLDIIEIRPGQGTFVCKKREDSDLILHLFSLDENLKKDTLVELLELRKIFESGILEIVVSKVNSKDLKELKKYLEKHKTDVEKNIYPSEYDISFHLLLAKATKNKVILNFFYSIFDLIKGVAIITGNKKENAIKALRYHKRIYNAIKERNVQMATKMMKEHMDWLIDIAKT